MQAMTPDVRAFREFPSEEGSGVEDGPEFFGRKGGPCGGAAGFLFPGGPGDVAFDDVSFERESLHGKHGGKVGLVGGQHFLEQSCEIQRRGKNRRRPVHEPPLGLEPPAIGGHLGGRGDSCGMPFGGLLEGAESESGARVEPQVPQHFRQRADRHAALGQQHEVGQCGVGEGFHQQLASGPHQRDVSPGGFMALGDRGSFEKSADHGGRVLRVGKHFHLIRCFRGKFLPDLRVVDVSPGEEEQGELGRRW